MRKKKSLKWLRAKGIFTSKYFFYIKRTSALALLFVKNKKNCYDDASINVNVITSVQFANNEKNTHLRDET